MNIRWLGPALLSAMLSGMLSACASIPSDRSQTQTLSLLQSRSKIAAQAQLSQNGAAEMPINQPLDADAAVRIAFMRNPQMQAWYAQLGIAQADVYDATRLSNPTFGFAQLSTHGVVTKTTWSVSQPITELLFLKFNSQVARSQLLQTQQRVANEVLLLEARTRHAYYEYVGAALVAQMRTQVATTATASSQFAEQLYAAGNISQFQLSREQAAASVAIIAQHKAGAQALATRGALLTVLGLSFTDQSVQFVEQLPLPTTATTDVAKLQDWTSTQRLDLLSTREALVTMQHGLAHAGRWRWLGGIDLGAEWERDGNDPTAIGPHANVELPLFNAGGGKVLRARAYTELLAAQLAAMELATRNDIAVQVAALKQAAAIVDEYRQHLVPLQEQVVSLTQQHQNFMLIGAFELLSAKQNQLDAYQSYLEAVRDYWLAHTELIRTAGGALPEAFDETGVMIGIEDSQADSNHAQHEMGVTP